MRSLLLLLLVAPLAWTAQAQSFSWFATTLTTTDSGLPHAAVRVLPESVWTAADSTVSLSPTAVEQVASARESGLKVIAQVGAGFSAPALDQLWEGVVDGLILPAGSFVDPVTRPEFTVLLASAPEDMTMDGALTPFGVAPGDWTGVDSVFAGRAPSQDQPMPAPTIVVPTSADSPLAVLSPGSVLLGDSLPAAVDDLLAFRTAHPAIASGVHLQLQAAPYAFYRGLRTSLDETDEVVVIAGATGSVRVNVSSVFDDDVVLRDRVSGQIGLVSFGQIMMKAGPSGLLLLEVVQ